MSRFLVIEGLIGVGKTTLCRLLGERWGARLILEPWADNPFLAKFYEDPDRFAFPAQMFYLATRYSQQQGIRQGDLFTDLVVSDYIFDKDRLFALHTLEGEEMELYDRFAGLLAHNVPRPDLVLFLDAPTEVIMKRIANRGIQAERRIQPTYLNTLRRRYLELWAAYDKAPVKILDTSEIDYVNDESDREAILGMIRGWLDGANGSGSPASAKPEWEDQPGLFSSMALGTEP
ncbi:MAG: deoxynucleoside kinase [Alphaproteobacteria bacterium]|nr:deoxynucleoside kinase [Alphaproteobacteria bacterium]